MNRAELRREAVAEHPDLIVGDVSSEQAQAILRGLEEVDDRGRRLRMRLYLRLDALLEGYLADAVSCRYRIAATVPEKTTSTLDDSVPRRGRIRLAPGLPHP